MAIFIERNFSAAEILGRVTHIYRVDQAIERPKREAARQKRAELKDPYLRIEREVAERLRSDNYSFRDADEDMSRLLRVCDTAERIEALHRLTPRFYEIVLLKTAAQIAKEIFTG